MSSSLPEGIASVQETIVVSTTATVNNNSKKEPLESRSKDIKELALAIRQRNAAEAFRKDASWRGPFFFIQGADPQFGMFDQWLRKKTDPDTITWDDDMKLMRAAIDDVNAIGPEHPQFFVVCGDLVNELDVNPLKKAQERDLLHMLTDVHPSIPIVLIPGNHDILNTPDASMIAHFEETFGPEYFSFDARGVRCICINSQYLKTFEEDVRESYPELKKKFFLWFDAEIERAAADLRSGTVRHAVVFQHIAWFLERPDEPTDYFNVDFDVRQVYLKKMLDAGIKACFCGHFHKNGGGKAGPNGELDVVITSAIGLTLGNDPSGLRLVKVEETGISHEFFPLGEMPRDVSF